MEKTSNLTDEEIAEMELNEHSLVIEFLGRLRGIRPDLRVKLAQGLPRLLEHEIHVAQTEPDRYPRSFEPALARSRGLHIDQE